MLEFIKFEVLRGARHILDDVSFRVPKGELTVLLGENGTGKTTLLSSVVGMTPYSGKIMLSGKDLSLYSPRERARQVSLLAQLLPMPNIRVKDLVRMGRNPYVGVMGALGEADKNIIEDAMEMACIKMFAERSIGSLSGGERQRAYLAMLLAQDSEVVLMDEPTTYLDMNSKREMFSLMRDLVQERKKTLFVVMHDLSDAMRIADHIVILSNGNCVFAGDVKRCMAENVIEKVFSVRRYETFDGEEKQIFFV